MGKYAREEKDSLRFLGLKRAETLGLATRLLGTHGS